MDPNRIQAGTGTKLNQSRVKCVIYVARTGEIKRAVQLNNTKRKKREIVLATKRLDIVWEISKGLRITTSMTI
jgi:hypothetical protein